ncbi:HEAT repeat domain-containing protein [Natrinema salinisoli]|uniref:HEAT repeat domain-containing protein n=1 Tax=Natrinema salinisoli TaxID=2878535 RepID=UPI001CEFB329|nr:HEAT repeat domain-containing protein [Natrinema salinisoli]
MYFTLKIVRFLFGLVFKVVLFPFKLVWRAAGKQFSSTDRLEDGLRAETDSSPAGESGEKPTGVSADDAGTASEGRSRSERNIRWFRKGLIAIGALQLGLGTLSVFAAFSRPAGLGFPQLAVFLLVLVIVALVPLIAGIGLSRLATPSWYLGMLVCGFNTVVSLFAFPAGLVTVILFGGLCYLGYTGRPALSRVYGAGLTTDSETPRTEEQAELDPKQGVAVADSTAESRTDATTSPLDQSSNSESTGGGPSAAADTEPEPTAPSSSVTANTQQTVASADDDGATSTTDSPVADEDVRAVAADAAEREDSVDTEPGSHGGTPDALDGLEAKLNDDQPSTRKAAVEELADGVSENAIPTGPAADAITARLDDPDADVRVAACDAIGRLEISQAKSSLRDLRIDPDREVSRAASRALRQLK